MIVVHHLNESRSQRILWLPEELGVPDEVESYHARRVRLPLLAVPGGRLALHRSRCPSS